MVRRRQGTASGGFPGRRRKSGDGHGLFRRSVPTDFREPPRVAAESAAAAFTAATPARHTACAATAHATAATGDATFSTTGDAARASDSAACAPSAACAIAAAGWTHRLSCDAAP